MDGVLLRGASIDLSASRFAWAATGPDRGRSLYDAAAESIVIPPFTVAKIYTQEVIYVTHRICGTYHSKVSLVADGLGHIGTTLDPGFHGPSLISMANLSHESRAIKVGSPFVSVAFDYVTNPMKGLQQPNDDGWRRLVEGYEGADDFFRWYDSTPWASVDDAMRSKCARDPKVCDARRNALAVDDVRSFLREHALTHIMPVVALVALAGALVWLWESGALGFDAFLTAEAATVIALVSLIASFSKSW